MVERHPYQGDPGRRLWIRRDREGLPELWLVVGHTWPHVVVLDPQGRISSRARFDLDDVVRWHEDPEAGRTGDERTGPLLWEALT